MTWEHWANLRVTLTQTEDVICWDVLLVRSQHWTSCTTSVMYPEEGTQDWRSPWWLLDSLADLFVSLAGCPVFGLRSEGCEASCAKHAPRALREGVRVPTTRVWRGSTAAWLPRKLVHSPQHGPEPFHTSEAQQWSPLLGCSICFWCQSAGHILEKHCCGIFQLRATLI